MHDIVILGNGGLGRSAASAFTERGDRVRTIGRPGASGHAPASFDGADVVIEATRGDAVAANVRDVLEAGCRRLVIATTGWQDDRRQVGTLLERHGAAAVVASNFSLGVALFGRLVETAVGLFGALDAFDPYLVEWHRRGKLDRPSGTARDLAARIVAGHPRLGATDDLEVVAIRAGASPGMHLVGFDAAGETVELRLTARDRSAYAAGILAAADWLMSADRQPGIHPFDPIVDELVARSRPSTAVHAA
jgi:4-hydroxy-tetrahydrodipicolinate reductase